MENILTSEAVWKQICQLKYAMSPTIAAYYEHLDLFHH